MNQIKLPTYYQEFIHLSRYSRWLPRRKRRETWEETVQRYFDYFTKYLKKKFNFDLHDTIRKELENAVLNLKVMPSMRALMTAGKALEKDNVACYNCAYCVIDNFNVFSEILYILTCGTGVGFSAERQYVNKLPEIPDELYDDNTVINVKDSKIGWARSYRTLIYMLYSGCIPKWDVSKIRPKGSRLKTFGGRASGPEPLVELFKFTINVFRGARGRKLSSIEVHDIVCKIADIVVSGGVRRSALISLSNLSDLRMRSAKTGQWWKNNPQRRLANNSVAYTEKPSIGIFMKEWLSLYESKSGERGIFNRVAALNKIKSLGRRKHEWDTGKTVRVNDGEGKEKVEKKIFKNYDFGCNPCSEIILRNCEFCNLSEVIVRADDDLESLKQKVRWATILGTMQATVTKFRFINKSWRKNCEEEALLGVSMTGIMDNKYTSNTEKYVNKSGKEYELKDFLTVLKNVAIETNKEWAVKIGINISAAIMCTKPSGTVSQLCDTASGIHARHAPYYIRTVRIDKKDPIGQFLIDNKIPCEDDVTNSNQYVFSFPIKSPEKSVMRNDMTAIEQLEFCDIYNKYWCDHKVSVTINVKEHEWFDVGAWVYNHFDNLSGVSFLPHSDHIYKQAPYQECTKEEYEQLLQKMPKELNWVDLKKYEKTDNTIGSQSFACSGNSCEVVDLVY
uniref:ribonucleoside-triphosphate reductase (thioredoxin) n=1 Tax=Mimivirus LCMiAC01 TaxID=2506608 RepID=A0A481Z058_9VIRU|nr:MAG: ribonucleotide reductase, barrel domain [Mimivirus LCMiAC01]